MVDDDMGCLGKRGRNYWDAPVNGNDFLDGVYNACIHSRAALGCCEISCSLVDAGLVRCNDYYVCYSQSHGPILGCHWRIPGIVVARRLVGWPATVTCSSSTATMTQSSETAAVKSTVYA